MVAIRLNLPPLAPYQREAIFCAERSSIIEACTKSGKTYGCILWLLAGAAEAVTPGCEFWWVAPTYPVSRIAFRRLVRLLKHSDPTHQMGWQINRAELSVTLGNGSVIRFKSGDNPDNLYGEDVYRAVIDEASRCKADVWTAIVSLLTATHGSVRIIGNVKGRKNWSYSLARRAQSGSMPGWKFASITADDAVRAGFIRADSLASAKAMLPHEVFRELYYNEPTEDGGNPFGLQHIRACAQEFLAPGPAVAFGLDLARKQDWTVLTGFNAEKRVCVFERWQRVPWGETIKRASEIIGHARARIDSTGVGDAPYEEIAKRCPYAEPFQFTSASKQRLMESGAVSIQRHEFGILAGTMQSEFESFEYEVHRTRTTYAAPSGVHDDCVCSHLLGIMAFGAEAVVNVKIVGGEPEIVDDWAERADSERERQEREFFMGVGAR